jgi:hypothetical protein
MIGISFLTHYLHFLSAFLWTLLSSPWWDPRIPIVQSIGTLQKATVSTYPVENLPLIISPQGSGLYTLLTS